MRSERVRVLVVDDQPEFRDAASLAVDVIDGFVVVDALPDAEHALVYSRANPVDLVLLDVNMPGIGGLEGARRLRELDDSLLVVLMSTYDPRDLPREVDGSGLHYVQKGSIDAAVLTSLWAAHRTSINE